MEPIDSIEDYNYDTVKYSNNPRPQEKGFYKQDWEGFFLHIGEVSAQGLPSSYLYLTYLSNLYNVPVPTIKRK